VQRTYISNMIIDEWRRWAVAQRVCVGFRGLVRAEESRREGREKERWERRVERWERGFGVSGG
jgi:hypothetical protein